MKKICFLLSFIFLLSYFTSYSYGISAAITAAGPTPDPVLQGKTTRAKVASKFLDPAGHEETVDAGDLTNWHWTVAENKKWNSATRSWDLLAETSGSSRNWSAHFDPDNARRATLYAAFFVKGVFRMKIHITVQLVGAPTPLQADLYLYFNTQDLDVWITAHVTDRVIVADSDYYTVAAARAGAKLSTAVTLVPSPADTPISILNQIHFQVLPRRGLATYTPGPATIDQNTPTTWTFKPFKEPKAEKHPRTVTLVLVPTYNGHVSGDRFEIVVTTVFVDANLHGDNNYAMDYVRWKYDVGGAYTTPGKVLVYDPTETHAGLTTDTGGGGRHTAIGPGAFTTENYLASTIGHEAVHTSQPASYFEWHWRAEKWLKIAEHDPYVWQWDTKVDCGLSADEVDDLRPWYLWVTGAGPKPGGGI